MKKTLVSQMCLKEKVTAAQLTNEIKILLKDEVIAKCDNDGNTLSVEFLNGQKFELTIKEV